MSRPVVAASGALLGGTVPLGHSRCMRWGLLGVAMAGPDFRVGMELRCAS
jgi:hypothetical protein